jgi:Na+/glutamate symporter
VENRQGLTKGLAIAGTALLWLPFAAMLATTTGSIPGTVGWFAFLAVGAMDLFPVVLLGGCLLIWAAVLARSHRRAIGWGLAAPVASIVAGVVWSPTVPGSGWPSAITVGLIVAYWLGVILAGLAGLSLARALVTRHRPEGHPSTVRG